MSLIIAAMSGVENTLDGLPSGQCLNSLVTEHCRLHRTPGVRQEFSEDVTLVDESLPTLRLRNRYFMAQYLASKVFRTPLQDLKATDGV